MTMLKIQLLSDRVLVRPDEPRERFGNIIIPESARKKATTGRVIALGPGMLMSSGDRRPMPDVTVGDRVLYLDQPWPIVEFEGERLLSMHDDGLLAVLDAGTEGEAA